MKCKKKLVRRSLWRRRMKKYFLFALILFIPHTTHANNINPQIGQSEWTILSNLGTVTDAEIPTTVMNADAGTPDDQTITIAASGSYIAGENLTKKIIINADNVWFDLHYHTIERSTGSENVITVNSSQTGVRIFNGTIKNSSGSGAGILINSGASDVHTKHLRIQGCGTGIRFSGSDGSEVADCQITSCDFIQSLTGLSLIYTDQTVVKSCTAFECSTAGFELLHGEANCILGCQALENSGSSSVAGFKSYHGKNNLFKQCVAKKTETTSTSFPDRAYGFLLTGTEEGSTIVKCIANNTEASASGDSASRGINLQPELLGTSDLLTNLAGSNAAGNDVYSVAWSPDAKYVATGDAGNDVRVFCFDGSSLVQIDNDTTPANPVRAVDWSPDGQYIVSGEYNYVRVFSFDGSTLAEIDNDTSPGAFTVYTIAWSPNGKYFASGDDGTYVRVFMFDGSTITQIGSNNTSSPYKVNSIDWSPDGKYIVSGDDGSYVRVFSFDGKTLAHVDADSTPTTDVNGVAWNPDGKHFASGEEGAGGYLRVFRFDGSTITYVTGINSPTTSNVNSVDWSPDGNYIVSGSYSNYVHIYSFNGSALTHIYGVTSPPTDNVNSVVWSPDGKYIVSGDTANYVYIWDAMNAPQNCLVNACKVSDTQAAYATLFGTGIAGGGKNYFTNNTSSANDANYTYGMRNVFFGDHNTMHPMDNISLPMGQ